MGEESWRVHVVGDNHVDPIVARDFCDEATIRTRYGMAKGDAPILVLFHPETTRSRDSEADMRTILDAVLARGRRTIVVYPCSDPGYEGVVRAIHNVDGRPGVSIHRNIDAFEFAGLMSVAACMVGNSSAGLIETPYHRIPAINVGLRQTGRLRSENVVDCEADSDDLKAALNKVLDSQEFRESLKTCGWPFGDGKAGQRVYEILKTTEPSHRIVDKRMAY
jgi:UDP-hydrolysing UDP-N-acetyl-D-glucosamine 2-epimerase